MTTDMSLLRLEMDESSMDGEASVEEDAGSFEAVEFEILPPVDVSDPRKVEIYKNIADIDERTQVISARVGELNSEIDRLTNHADKLDYTISVASGVLTGIIDIFFVGEFSITDAKSWGKEKVEQFVVWTAKKKGYKKEDLPGAVNFLEKKFPIAADKAKDPFGGGKQHHLRDFSHHPTPVGLIFSLLTQFTGKVYGTDVAGVFQVVSVDATDLIGANLKEKLIFGVVTWFFHMVSDMAGSYSSVIKGKLGTGLPGPLVSLLKEVSSLPFFRNTNKKGYKEFSVWVSKLFNGTLLGKRDENGKIIEGVQFDLRTEIGVAHEIGKQAIPVVINECIVRAFYFIRRLYKEMQIRHVECVADLEKINWRNTLPYNNRTITRMLTIATGTFTAIDLADAAIRAMLASPAGFAAFAGQFILRVNFVGLGRFAIAIFVDIKMAIQKMKMENERICLRGEWIHLQHAKVFYKEADMWIEAENTEEAMQKMYQIAERSMTAYAQACVDIQASLDTITDQVVQDAEEKNAGLTEELLDLLEWGR